MRRLYKWYDKVFVGLIVAMSVFTSITQVAYAGNGQRWSVQYGCKGKGCVNSAYVSRTDIDRGLARAGTSQNVDGSTGPINLSEAVNIAGNYTQLCDSSGSCTFTPVSGAIGTTGVTYNSFTCVSGSCYLTQANNIAGYYYCGNQQACAIGASQTNNGGNNRTVNNPPGTPTPPPAIPYNFVTGGVYLDRGNVCSTAIPVTFGTSLTVTLKNTTYSTRVGANGAFSLFVPSGTYPSLELTGLTGSLSTYHCSSACTNGCPSKSSVISPSVGNNYFLSDIAVSWWQTAGAGVYAGGAVGSTLPTASSRLIVPQTGGTAAALLTGSNNNNFGLGNVSDRGWATKTTYRGRIMGYDYFSAHMGVVAGQGGNWSRDEAITLDKYDLAKDFGYMNPIEGSPAIIDAQMIVNSPNKYVIFVNGDLRINENIIVQPGGFLAFIVNGDVIVSPRVTKMEGLFVMDNDYKTESNYQLGVVNDVPLDVQGSVVAWGAFDIKRNLGVGNNLTPAEKFTYRPDLLTNMPDRMKVFAMQWQEVTAGTIGN